MEKTIKGRGMQIQTATAPVVRQWNIGTAIRRFIIGWRIARVTRLRDVYARDLRQAQSQGDALRVGSNRAVIEGLEKEIAELKTRLT